MPHVSSGIRNIWSIPRFQPIASVVLELQGIWRGCSNKSSGYNDAVIPAKLRKVYRPEDFDLIIENFKPEVYKFDDETVIKFDPCPNFMSDSEIVMLVRERNLKRQKDLEKQCKCSEEEITVLRKGLSKLEENKNLRFIKETDDLKSSSKKNTYFDYRCNSQWQRSDSEIVMLVRERNLKRQKDLEKQCKCSEEEITVLRKGLSKLEKENKDLRCIKETDNLKSSSKENTYFDYRCNSQWQRRKFFGFVHRCAMLLVFSLVKVGDVTLRMLTAAKTKM